MTEPLNMNNDYNQWNLMRIKTPADGHCLFHALLSAFFIPYINETYNGEYLSKNDIIKNFRYELSLKLPEHYKLINKGNTKKFSKDVPEFKLTNMQKELNSNHFIGYGYLEFIANQINKDIFILDDNGDVYKGDEIPLLIKNRNAIILYYKNFHYELVGLNINNNIQTHFSTLHPLIKFLKTKIT